MRDSRDRSLEELLELSYLASNNDDRTNSSKNQHQHTPFSYYENSMFPQQGAIPGLFPSFGRHSGTKPENEYRELPDSFTPSSHSLHESGVTPSSSHEENMYAVNHSGLFLPHHIYSNNFNPLRSFEHSSLGFGQQASPPFVPYQHPPNSHDHHYSNLMSRLAETMNCGTSPFSSMAASTLNSRGDSTTLSQHSHHEYDKTSSDILSNEKTSSDVFPNEKTSVDVFPNEKTSVDAFPNEKTSVDLLSNEKTSVDPLSNDNTSQESTTSPSNAAKQRHCARTGKLQFECSILDCPRFGSRLIDSLKCTPSPETKQNHSGRICEAHYRKDLRRIRRREENEEHHLVPTKRRRVKTRTSKDEENCKEND